ncbi:meiotic dynein intermediate light chain Dli1/Dil1 [Schizosaccharomyces osmophilus]|uniref:Meiotic dynein intermediate light chain Dli1/Dil1 n=1 Tax=Schizosaccharomyces osmophilus TaxID=2545709 RepID=A0AAF0AV66_9SCHI|nr:meiotic dynein intermediate light chain Dli1/Dil1 [Schizosaccharomyces osmophilus]WBW73261.1 meiotic dynein intermediate light chain Dli1/Dil1 [Schizosaccharomyces osmophilus]
MEPILEKLFNQTLKNNVLKESSILLIGNCSGFSDLLGKCNIHSISKESKNCPFISSPIVNCYEISYECFALYTDIGEKSHIIHVWQSSCITDQLLQFFVHQSLRSHGLDALWVIYVNHVFFENPKGFAKELLEVLRVCQHSISEFHQEFFITRDKRQKIMNQYHSLFSTIAPDEFSSFFNFTLILPQLDDDNETPSMNDDMKDFIQQFARSLLLLIPTSSLMYLSSNPYSWDNFKSLLKLYLLNDESGIIQENHRIIAVNTIENDRLLVPPCWDTMQKIQNVNLKFQTVVVDVATKQLHQVFETDDLIIYYESNFHNQRDNQRIPDDELDFPCKSHQQFLMELLNKYNGFQGHEGATKQLHRNQNPLIQDDQDEISLSNISKKLNVGQNHESNNALSIFFSDILNENIN